MSEHFPDAETRCPCGKCDGGRMNPMFMGRLERLRTLYGKPMPVVSAYRCHAHNVAVGGVGGSMHEQGRAVDVTIPNSRERFQLIRLATGMGCFGGIGINKSTVHLDDRNMAEAMMWHYYR